MGISYFTLKMITYAADLYLDKVHPQNNLLDFALFVSFFPAMTAGPVVRYETVEAQLRNRHESIPQFAAGIRLFCIGLTKKVMLSNTVAVLASDMLAKGGDQIGLIGAWAGLLAYTMQLYFDFSGYSDMAIGLAKMFGFQLEKNFNYPYIAKSVTEFWRRWHISLSTFFRIYIYIPLGGSRVGDARLVLNTAIVWLITGIWHGAAWNFIYWGLFYFAVIMLEKFVLNRFLTKLPAAIQHLYTIFVFMMAWALFWISDLDQLGMYLAALFGAYGLTGASTFWELQAWSFVPVFVICIIASTPLVPWLKSNLSAWCNSRNLPVHAEGIGKKDVSAVDLCNYDALALPQRGAKSAFCSTLLIMSDIALLIMTIVSICSIVAGSFSPLIYFNF